MAMMSMMNSTRGAVLAGIIPVISNSFDYFNWCCRVTVLRVAFCQNSAILSRKTVCPFSNSKPKTQNLDK